jgi:hypothetical protein
VASAVLGDTTVLGRTVRIDGEPYTVVGVQATVPPMHDWQPSLLLPLAFTDEQIASPYYFFALSSGRLAPGVTVEQASAEASAVWKQVTATRPSPSGGGIEVAALKTSFLSEGRARALWLLMGAVACVLLIACANVREPAARARYRAPPGDRAPHLARCLSRPGSSASCWRRAPASRSSAACSESPWRSASCG